MTDANLPRGFGDRFQLGEALRNIIENTSGVTGRNFFRALVRQMAKVLGMRYSAVSELVGPAQDRVRTLAMWVGEDFGLNFEYTLSGAPCETVVGQELRIYARSVQHQFPHAHLLAEMGAECYVGVPLFDSYRRPLGLLTLYDDRPYDERANAHAPALLSLFAARAGAEIQRQRVEQALFEERERALVTLHAIGDAVIRTDPSGAIDYMNPVAEQLTGWRQREAIGLPIEQIFPVVHEHTRQPADNAVARVLIERRVINVADHTVLVSRSGEEFAVEHSAAPISGRDAECLGVVVVFRDVSEARRLAAEISYQATHDPLTGLVNRRAFESRLDAALTSARNDNKHHGLCFLDLDQFKIVNDTCGHVAGDELLKQFAGLLQVNVRESDTVGRLGGDEFGILLDGCPLDKAQIIAHTLLEAIRDFRFVWQEQTFEIGVSIGLVPITAAANMTQLLTQADVACYAAKDLGRNRIHVHRPEDAELARWHRELRWAADINGALEQNRFRLYCQPIKRLASANGEHEQYEILLRLVNDDGTMVLPDDFIPAAERYNLMGAIDRWVIHNTFRFYAERHGVLANSDKPVRVAINLSGNSLNEDKLLHFIQQELKEFNIPPNLICFEITETAAISNLSRAAQFIREMKKLGCRFALDDFGTGVSSFAYLKNLPVDYIKIDGAFVGNIVNDRIDHAMVAAINQIGHEMGIETIAESAESNAIVDRLRSLGVDYAQGFVLGKPRPVDAPVPHPQARLSQQR
jgi:diguanylate cyclase (GGDEF)-like protein/PAS domain S-box-containing protein